MTLTRGVPVAARWDTGFGDWASGIPWEFDGTKLIFLPPPPRFAGYSPTRGMSQFSSYLFRPPEGYYLKENFPSGGPIDFYFLKGHSCTTGQTPGSSLSSGVSGGTGPVRVTGPLDVDMCYQRLLSGALPSPNHVTTCENDSAGRQQICSSWIPTGISALQLSQQ